MRDIACYFIFFWGGGEGGLSAIYLKDGVKG